MHLLRVLIQVRQRVLKAHQEVMPDRVLDEKSCRFGFRTLQFVAGGLYLNGQRVELRGLNRRQSYAYQGYACLLYTSG